MSATVMGWLLGRWSFGRSEDRSEEARLSRAPIRVDPVAADGDVERVAASAAVSPAMLEGRPISDILIDVRSGSEAALGVLYRGYYQPLWRMAVTLVQSADAADDIVQELFVSLWMRRHRLKPDDDIRAYLYASVRYRAERVWRHQRVARRVESAVAERRMPMPGIGNATRESDAATEQNDVLAAYTHALATLPPRERIALQLRHDDEMTFEQIGDVLGISKVGARKIVLRAQALIREKLAAYRS